jgi:hypothetical protein
MPTWGNTDAANQKPKFDLERTTREVLQFIVRTGNTAGNNIIQVAYTDGGQNNVANIGVAVNQYVYFMNSGFANPGGTAGNGYPGFFASNTQVSAISGNTITLGTNLFNTVAAGYGVEFDTKVVWPTGLASTYNQDTILVTPSRLANTKGTTGGAGSTVANTQLGSMVTGWNLIQRKINNDGTVRFLKECLVALANPVAANTSSANTSANAIFGGL